ncbi:ArpU family phage packaging/lysis transcriptional regulator [Paenibacillus odorifer]|uniref:ArpU family phage packaging/lysis transcriptional regulator n=1 Tax=Paenibacillus odorifer TaxID=189426 RepID=UPI002DB678DC|nr:ArpU family phage packaging/lysis transcriptional regulator [Paenibacillus odorifer]MEC0131513.1 ArpU family phage packaging/lysis transcriptional regulator [Paenibacillus odorifer]MEC0220334.1 ArpU family phage packaging/lysis transcriptional regulator [Paenibacillus odorifer]
MGKSDKLAIQLAFDILPIDEKETRRRVEEYLETVRVYRQIGFVRRQAALTASPEPRYHGSTNAISRTTENIAVWNTDREVELERQSKLLDLAMGRLKKAEREIIQLRYLEYEDEYDSILCGELGMSERKYRRVKSRAIYLLACALGLEVLIECVNTIK